MEYEILVEKNSNGRVIVDFYGIDFDITDEFVNGKCYKVIFGDQIVFVLKGAEIKEEPVESSNTSEAPEAHEETPEPEHPEASEEKHDEVAEEPEKHNEPEHSEETVEYSPVETPEADATDNNVGTSEEVHNEEKPVENPENLVATPEDGHAPVEAETEEAEEADKKRGKKAKEEAIEEN